ncbi:hypothetical protein ACHAQA_008456 [Verticillium albo-atrum]
MASPSLHSAALPAATIQSHASNLLQLPDKTLLCTWFGGSQEGLPDISIWLSRQEPGSAIWSPPQKISFDTNRSCQNPVLFRAPKTGDIWLFHTSQDAGNQDGAFIMVRTSSDSGVTWSEPKYPFKDRKGVFVRQPVIILQDGSWALPVFHCRSALGQRWIGNDDISAVLYSRDDGQTWDEKVVLEGVGAVHMNIVSPAKGKSDYVAVFRSRWADSVYRSTSKGGLNWAPPTAISLPNPNSGICAARLPSGNIAIVFNNSAALPEMDKREGLYDDITPEDDKRPNQASVNGKTRPLLPTTLTKLFPDLKMVDLIVPTEADALVHDKAANTVRIKKVTVPKPAGADEHLIRVHAVAITNGELAWPEPLLLEDPIPGFEVAGTVIQAASESPFPAGSEVYARTDFERHGSARPFTIVTTAELSRKPKNLTWEEAATVPLSALTAWQALFVHGGLTAPAPESPGVAQQENAKKRVLVTAAAGGVGIFLVQLARLAGAHIVGVCGAANMDFVSGLGADEVLDYRKTDLVDWVNEKPEARTFDLTIDCVGKTALKQVWQATKSGGKLVSITEDPDPGRPADGVGEDISSLFFIVKADSGQLEHITRLIEVGTLKAFVDDVFDFHDGARAFEKVGGRSLRGKVVLRVD